MVQKFRPRTSVQKGSSHFFHSWVGVKAQLGADKVTFRQLSHFFPKWERPGKGLKAINDGNVKISYSAWRRERFLGQFMHFLLMLPFSSLSDGKYHVWQSFIMLQKSEPFVLGVNYLTKYDMTRKVLCFFCNCVLYQLSNKKIVLIHGGYTRDFKCSKYKGRINF